MSGKHIKKKRKAAFSKKSVIAYFGVLGLFAAATIILAALSILQDFTGSLSYLSYPFTALSAAGAVILPAYYSKSAKENTAGGIVYEAAAANNFESI
jgi:hypothetical protein